METLAELKAIIAGKPGDEVVTHIDSDGTYWFMNPESQSMFYDHDGLNYCEPQEPLRSLSDIERIIELMELNQNMHTTVAGYLWGKDWAHWNEFNAGKFKL